MENQEEKTNRKMYSAMAVAFVVIIAAFVAYYMGLIPGIGQGQKVADELQAKIVASKGANLKTNFLAYAQANPQMTAPQKELLQNIAQNSDVDFEFAGTKTSSGDGKGTVEIDSPKLTLSIKNEGQAPQTGEISAPKLFISQDVADKNHFFYHTEGDIDFAANLSGSLSKIFSIAGEQPFNEIKFNADGYTGYFKSNTKNIKFIEGRGNTVVATIGESDLESKSSFQNGKMDIYGKMAEKNIVPGDMIKIMLGNIEPISIGIDYAYKGDDFRPALQELKNYDKAGKTEKLKEAADPNYKPQEIAPGIKPFEGNLKLNDVSILMGNAGFVLNGSLEFKKANATAIPFGDLDFKISQYQKLIDYFSRFFKMPKEQIDKTVQMASEIGTNANGDISFKISFDGTENIKVNDKTSDQLKAITAKYYMPPAEPTTPAPPAAVTSRPIAPVPASPTLKK